jgi:hypothetical protein
MFRILCTLILLAGLEIAIPRSANAQSVQTYTRSQCITLCLARGANRTKASCSPWCAQGCRNATNGERYCVKG